MRFRRLISSMIASVMLFTSLAIPASADVSINAGGGNNYPTGSGFAGADKNWSIGTAWNRFGYRISVYYAPQKTDGSNYVYDSDGNPVYDWDNTQKVGKSIDIRKYPMGSDKKGSDIMKPSLWGDWSRWDYNSNALYDGTMYKNFYDWADGSDYGHNYYYFVGTDSDKSAAFNQGNYMCAVFNDELLSNTLGYSLENTTNSNSSYGKIMSKLDEMLASTSDEKVKDIINNTKGELGKSVNAINNLGGFNLPIINDMGERTNSEVGPNERGDLGRDNLTHFLLFPAILDLIGSATGGNFNAYDFYFGSWKDVNGGAEFERGTYKMLVENMTTALVDGTVTSFTLADSIAMGTFSGFSIYSQYGSEEYASGMINSLMLDKSEPVLKFSTNAYSGYMGDKKGKASPSEYEKGMVDEVLKYSPIDQFIGNYSGLAVIDSDSIYSRADVVERTDKIINEVMVSWIGDADLGVTGLQINMDANDLSTLLSEDDINDICAAFDNEDVNLIAEKAGLEDDGSKLQLTALCDAIRRGRA